MYACDPDTHLLHMLAASHPSTALQPREAAMEAVDLSADEPVTSASKPVIKPKPKGGVRSSSSRGTGATNVYPTPGGGADKVMSRLSCMHISPVPTRDLSFCTGDKSIALQADDADADNTAKRSSTLLDTPVPKKPRPSERYTFKTSSYEEIKANVSTSLQQQ